MFLAAAICLQLQAQAPFLRTPSIHGNTITFISEGDVWVGDLTTGEARRLTTDAGVEAKPIFSPDGTAIAFAAEYDGDHQIYSIPTAGGTPTRLTNVTACRVPTSWTPDGKSVVFRKLGSPTAYQFYTVPATGGASTKLPLEFASYVSMAPTGNDFTFTRFYRSRNAWFRYIGGQENQIWTYRGGKFQAITDLPGTSEYPVWTKDRIYFAHEEKGSFSLLSVPATGGKPRTELGPDGFEIRELTTDGDRVVFEHGQGVQIFDPAKRSVTDVHMHLTTDLIHMRPNRVSVQQNVFDGHPSPTGKRLFLESHGQIVSLPGDEGEARVWKVSPGVRYRCPSMSPDAKSMAYLSDATGQVQLYVSDAAGGHERQLTKDDRGTIVEATWSPDGKSILIYDSRMQWRLVNVAAATEVLVCHTSGAWSQPSIAFSPDSKWLAFIDPRGGSSFGQVNLYEIATGKTTIVSNPLVDDVACRFSQDGKYLAVISRRNFSVTNDSVLNQLNTGDTLVPVLIPLSKTGADPLALKDAEESPKDDTAKDEPKKDEPKKDEAKKDESKKPETPSSTIDMDGFMDRRVELPLTGKFTDIWVIKDNVYLQDGDALKAFDLGSKATKAVTTGGGFELTADGSKMLVSSNGHFSFYDLGASSSKAVSFGGLTLAVDPVKEYRQIYWEAWRDLRDYFYVQNMHGLDWKAVGDKYAVYLPLVHSRDELDELIRWMQAEIGSSHEYIAGGDTQDLKRRTSVPSLGIDVEADPSGFYKITHLVHGDGFLTSERSPLIGPGKNVTEGMFLVEVAGVPTSASADPFLPLIGRAGQIISVKVNAKPELEGATTILVKPVGDDSGMRYREWVQTNRDLVTKLSGGRVGYLHLAAMGDGDFVDFIKQYLGQRDKDAIIIDARFNGGGYVQEMINRILATRLSGFFNMRDSKYPWTRQGDYFNGPLACLINEFDVSCGEEFPYRFQQLKLGPLIGRRTMGGEVGSDPGWPFVDGGKVYVPNYGFWTPEKGWQIEGHGVTPDIDVPSDPNMFLLGRDPQIEKAVEVLLKQLPAHPVWQAPQPESKDRVKDPIH